MQIAIGGALVALVSARVIPFHEKYDTDLNPESLAVSKFFNCEL